MCDNCILLIIKKINMIIYCMNEDTFLNASQIFYYLASGIGLLFAGIGGIIAFKKWQYENNERKKKEKIKEEFNDEITKIKSKYPIYDFDNADDENRSYRLIKVKNKKKVFIHIKKNNIKIHIKTYFTFEKLGFESITYNFFCNLITDL